MARTTSGSRPQPTTFISSTITLRGGSSTMCWLSSGSLATTGILIKLLWPCLMQRSFMAAATSSSTSQRHVSHPLQPINASNDRYSRTAHPWQAEFCQQLGDILNEFINNNNGYYADSTYQKEDAAADWWCTILQAAITDWWTDNGHCDRGHHVRIRWRGWHCSSIIAVMCSVKAMKTRGRRSFLYCVLRLPVPNCHKKNELTCNQACQVSHSFSHHDLARMPPARAHKCACVNTISN